MNESYFQSVIEDRHREVSNVVKDNQTPSHLKDVVSNKPQSKSISNLPVLLIGKQLEGFFTIYNKHSLNVRDQYFGEF